MYCLWAINNHAVASWSIVTPLEVSTTSEHTVIHQHMKNCLKLFRYSSAEDISTNNVLILIPQPFALQAHNAQICVMNQFTILYRIFCLCSINSEQDNGSVVNPYKSDEFEDVGDWGDLTRRCSVLPYTLGLLRSNTKQRRWSSLKHSSKETKQTCPSKTTRACVRDV